MNKKAYLAGGYSWGVEYNNIKIWEIWLLTGLYNMII